MKYDTVFPRGKEDSSVQFFIYIHAYSAAQRTVTKQIRAKDDKNKHRHKERQNTATYIIYITITINLAQSCKPLCGDKRDIYIYKSILNTISILIIRTGPLKI